MEKRAYGYVSEFRRHDLDTELTDLLNSLEPFERVKGNRFKVGVFDGNNLRARRFLLRPTDRQPITLFESQTGKAYKFQYPGKSGFLYSGCESPSRDDLDKLIESGMKRRRTRHDHLHLARVDDVESVGWKTFWAPLPGRDSWLHVRVVANITLEEGRSPTETDASALCSVFEKKI